jgi:hypothetical protein
MMLSEIVKKIANTLKFNYFDMAYVDVPIEKSNDIIFKIMYLE